MRARAVATLTAELLESQAAHAQQQQQQPDDAKQQQQQQQQPNDAKQHGGKQQPHHVAGDDAAVAAALARCSPHLVYALKRLARGLASGRDGARQGYAAALGVLLAHAAGSGGGGNGSGSKSDGGKAAKKHKAAGAGAAGGWIDLSGALALVEGCLPVTGSMKGTVRPFWLDCLEKGGGEGKCVL